jgi:molecular chaperone DnaJ
MIRTQTKDYYGVLGVARDASQDDIKSAYRKIAKEHHPDATGGDKDSESRFKEASEAYEVLSDPEKRSGYDNSKEGGGDLNHFFGDIFAFMFGTDGRRNRRQYHRDILVRIAISMSEAYSGCNKKVAFERIRHCHSCNGSGMVAKSSTDNKCPSCHGTGLRYGVARVPCQSCGGTGKSGMTICDKCNWKGHTTEPATIDITIPPRLAPGSSFRFNGQGNIDPSGSSGDVHIEVLYPSRELGFNVDRDGNMGCVITVPWGDALAGKETEVSILGISKISLKLDGSKRDGSIYRFNGVGMGDGDLLVKVVHVLPENIGEEDRKALSAILSKYANTKTGSGQDSDGK